jgi:hypothetical protein
MFSPPQRLKAGIVEQEEAAVAMQQLGKHIPSATNTQATLDKLLDAVLYMWSLSYQIQ